MGTVRDFGRTSCSNLPILQGQFPDVYAGQERPTWSEASVKGEGTPPPPDDPPAAALTPAPGKLLLVGNAQMFHRNFLVGGNVDFFLNSVDALTLGDELIHVRSKKPIDRTMDKPTPAQRQFWKFVNLGLVNLVVVLVGVGGAVWRRRCRDTYTVAQVQK